MSAPSDDWDGTRSKPTRRDYLLKAGLSLSAFALSPTEVLSASGISLLRRQSPAPASQSAADLIELGRDNWERPWAPDLAHEGRPIPLPPEQVMDVLIVGDGYLPNERERFVRDLKNWYAEFLALTPWHAFRGAIRVRGLWTPSQARATPERGSYFELPATRADVGVRFTTTTRERLFGALERAGLLMGDPEHVHGYVTGVVLVLADRGTKSSGHARRIASPDDKFKVEFALGAYSLHEFGHARAGVHDEYIRAAGESSRGAHPWRVTMFGNSNISYTRDLDRIPWRHLLPGAPDNPDPNSVIGLLWLGGDYEFRAWHSEPFCLQNGKSSNWDLSHTKRPANLRNFHRYCFWCEELVAATLFARTGQLGGGDAADAWKQWADSGRANYQRLFTVRSRIVERNREYSVNPAVMSAKIVEKPVAGAHDDEPIGSQEPAKDPDTADAADEDGKSAGMPAHGAP